MTFFMRNVKKFKIKMCVFLKNNRIFRRDISPLSLFWLFTTFLTTNRRRERERKIDHDRERESRVIKPAFLDIIRSIFVSNFLSKSLKE